MAYTTIRNAIIRATWKKQVLATYQAIQNYGPDAFLAMALKPRKTLGIPGYLMSLERKGLLCSHGFTAEGERWFKRKAGKKARTSLEGFQEPLTAEPAT